MKGHKATSESTLQVRTQFKQSVNKIFFCTRRKKTQMQEGLLIGWRVQPFL